MQELRVGIIGFGFIGKVHAHAHRSVPLFYDPPPLRTRLAVVCTSREETARKAVAQGGFEQGATEWRRVVERDDIDLVHVCTPNHLHRDIVLAALASGKHVYCDKPLCMNLTEAREIAAAAGRAQSLHQMTFHIRFVPAVMRARRLIEDGFIGKPFHFRAAYLHDGYSDPQRPMTWRLRKELAGAGALGDLGSHIIDLMRHLLGEYESVNATAETYIERRPTEKGSSEMAPVEVDDYVLIRARMRGGGIGVIEASRFATGTSDDLKFEIYGERGALKFNLMDPNFLYAYDARDPGGELGGMRGFKAIACVQHYPRPSALPSPKLPVGWIRFHIASLHNFLAAIAEDRQPTPSLLDGAATQAVMEAVLESSERRQWAPIGEV
ncbi:MAG: Gfo/Idh/MocA family protein [Armatimonadota bacterium]